MKSVLFYFLQSIIASGILYGYYHVALRNKKFHLYNRFYLLGSIIISILIPFLQIPLYFEETEMRSSVVLQTLHAISSPVVEQQTADPPTISSATTSSPFNWNIVLYGLYLLAIALLFLRIAVSLRKLRVIIKNNPVEHVGGIHFINTAEPGTPFSFFTWLFWNKQIEIRSDNGKQIFRHELFHIRQKHSLDILFMEAITAIFWINPFFHLMKKEQKAIHEFLADQFAIRKTDEWAYAELLLMQALNTQQRLVNPFFHNQIKRRIAMITNPQKTSHRYLRKLLVLPLGAIIITLFAFKYKERKEADKSAIKTDHAMLTETTGATKNHFADSTPRVDVKTLFPPPAKHSPTAEQLKTWSDGKIYGIWVDEKRIDNIDLGKYQFSDFALFYLSKLEKNAVNYGKHYYQVDLFTHDHYNKTYPRKWTSISNIIPADTSHPLIVIDLKEHPELTIDKLDKILSPDEILFINVLKDKIAIAKYGEAGKNGVIEIVTKKAKGKEVTMPGVEVKDASVQDIPVTDDNKIFERVEIEPAFPGGYPAWRQFLERNVNSTIPVKNGAPVGKYTVYIQFIVDKDGSIRDVRPITNRGFGMEQEAVRVIKEGPAWVPAMQNGRKVNAYRKQPITFEVIDDKNYDVTVMGHKTTEMKGVAIDKKTGYDLNEIVVVGFSNSDQKVKTNPADTTPAIKYKEVTLGNKDPIFEKVEIEASFPGGETAWKKYLQTNLNQSVAAQNSAPEGKYTIYIQFVVFSDGYIGWVKPLTKHGFGMEQEAKRLIGDGPRWIPGIQNGHKVNSYKKQAIDFVVPNKLSSNSSQNSSSNGVTTAYQPKPYTPKISIGELKKTNPTQLMGLPEEATLSSFTFTIDTDSLDIATITNTGSKFNETILKLINNTSPRHMITLENVAIVWNGKKQKVPARFYEITN